MRTIIHTALAVSLFAACILIAAPSGVHAQVTTSCCTFAILTNNGTPNACLPVNVTTSWLGSQQTDAVTATGTLFPFSINGCSGGGSTLDSIQVDGNWVVPNSLPYLSGCFTWSCGTGQRFRIAVSQNAMTGCLEIRITGC